MGWGCTAAASGRACARAAALAASLRGGGCWLCGAVSAPVQRLLAAPRQAPARFSAARSRARPQSGEGLRDGPLASPPLRRHSVRRGELAGSPRATRFALRQGDPCRSQRKRRRRLRSRSKSALGRLGSEVLTGISKSARETWRGGFVSGERRSRKKGSSLLLQLEELRVSPRSVFVPWLRAAGA